MNERALPVSVSPPGVAGSVYAPAARGGYLDGVVTVRCCCRTVIVRATPKFSVPIEERHACLEVSRQVVTTGLRSIVDGNTIICK